MLDESDGLPGRELLRRGCAGRCGAVLADGSPAQVPSAAPRYTITDLGALGKFGADPRSINGAGQVVGVSPNQDNYQRAFLWQHGKIIELPAFMGDQDSMAFSINSQGQVVGNSTRDGGATHAVLWEHSRVVDLGLVGTNDLQYGGAGPINDSGQVIVNRTTAEDNSLSAMISPSLQTHQVLLCTRAGVRSGRPLGADFVSAAAMNNSGEIVGQKWAGVPRHLRAYLWKDGMTTDLGAFQPGGINASGQIIGLKLTGPPPVVLALLWRNGTLARLSTPAPASALATGINDRGDIVGFTLSGQSYTPQSALLWSGGAVSSSTTASAPKADGRSYSPRRSTTVVRSSAKESTTASLRRSS